MSLLSFFIDPVVRAPTIGCILMGVVSALIGVITLVQKRSLLGETLSHAAYPGVVAAIFIGSLIPAHFEQWKPVWVLAGAALSAVFGMWLINRLTFRFGFKQDAALCFVLSAFFGIGITVASRLQFTHTAAYRQIERYLYGQAATMTDFYIPLYGVLACLVAVILLLLFKEVRAYLFDRGFAEASGIHTRLVEGAILFLLVLSIVMGIRSVGVVLMSAMMVAPAAAARQLTHRFGLMFLYAACFGGLSGLLGNVLSVVLGGLASPPISLPTGPMIVLVATSFCLLSLMFAPRRGVVFRSLRVAGFRYRCLQENLLKAVLRLGESDIPFKAIAATQSINALYLRFVLGRLVAQGWMQRVSRGTFQLTLDGKRRARRIIRLHRLWELYLAEQLGMGKEKVHCSAEQMEHIITPELERRLTNLLNNPAFDPHAQPIPPRNVTA